MATVASTFSFCTTARLALLARWATPTSSSFTASRRLLHATPAPCRPSLTVPHFAPKTKNFKRPRSLIAPPGTPQPHRVAIVGAGLAGLSVCYHLLNSTARFARKRQFDSHSLTVTVFDPATPGSAGASAAAAGLLHNFSPRPKKKIWQFQKSIDATHHLLDVAQAAADAPLAYKTGLLRLARHDRDIEDYQIAARRFPHETLFLDPQDVLDRFPHANPTTVGLLLRNAYVVDTRRYMRALWTVCQQSGRVVWNSRAVQSVDELLCPTSGEKFDTVVLCAGAALLRVAGVSGLQIRPRTGHNLLFASEGVQDVDAMPFMSANYIVPHPFGVPPEASAGDPASAPSSPTRYVVAGPSREADGDAQYFPRAENLLEESELPRVKDDLRDVLLHLMPSLYDEWRVAGSLSGVRAMPLRTPLGSIPVVDRVHGTPHGTSCWMFTGLGGRGLLYHAFLGRKLAHAVVAGNERLIPFDARERKLSVNLRDDGDCEQHAMGQVDSAKTATTSVASRASSNMASGVDDAARRPDVAQQYSTAGKREASQQE